MKKNILFVSIAFPPKNDAECLQAAKYFKYLARDKELSVSVVTSSTPTLFMPFDAQLQKYDTSFVQKIELPIYESKLTNFVLRKIIPGGIDYPDSKFTFHLQKRRVINTLRKKPDIIYSRSNPLSSAFLAYKLKKYFSVPWVMHLSDPWLDSPIHNFSPKQKAFHKRWEEQCFHSADSISFTSARTLNFYSEKYPALRNKFQYYPNVYDGEDEISKPLNFNGKLQIVYTGGLSGSRSPESFMTACSQLQNENSYYSEKFEAIFAGPLDKKNRALFESNKLQNVKHIGEIPYNKALQLISHAHLLLSIDLPLADSKAAMFFPSKLLDYFLAKRKILALTNEGSTTDQILKKVNAKVCEHNDVESIKNFLIETINAFEKRDEKFFLQESIPNDFNAKLNAERLAALFHKL